MKITAAQVDEIRAILPALLGGFADMARIRHPRDKARSKIRCHTCASGGSRARSSRRTSSRFVDPPKPGAETWRRARARNDKADATRVYERDEQQYMEPAPPHRSTCRTASSG